MSRYVGGYESDGPNTIGIWTHALNRSIASKRGKAFLRELRDALLAMPERKLATGAWCQDGAVCALGAMAVHREVERTGQAWVEVVAMLETDLNQDATGIDYWSVKEAVERFAMQRTLAWEIGYQNDERATWGWEVTAEIRWQRVYEWVCGLLGETA